MNNANAANMNCSYSLTNNNNNHNDSSYILQNNNNNNNNNDNTTSLIMLTNNNNANNTSSFAFGGMNVTEQGSYEDDDSSFLSKNYYKSNNQTSTGVQTANIDEALFPPFDRRVCLRCKKNDMISPNYCKFENIQSIDELSSCSGRSSYKVSKQHIYGTKINWSKRN